MPTENNEAKTIDITQKPVTVLRYTHLENTNKIIYIGKKKDIYVPRLLINPIN